MCHGIEEPRSLTLDPSYVYGGRQREKTAKTMDGMSKTKQQSGLGSGLKTAAGLSLTVGVPQ